MVMAMLIMMVMTLRTMMLLTNIQHVLQQPTICPCVARLWYAQPPRLWSRQVGSMWLMIIMSLLIMLLIMEVLLTLTRLLAWTAEWCVPQALFLTVLVWPAMLLIIIMLMCPCMRRVMIVILVVLVMTRMIAGLARWSYYDDYVHTPLMMIDQQLWLRCNSWLFWWPGVVTSMMLSCTMIHLVLLSAVVACCVCYMLVLSVVAVVCAYR